MDKNAIVSQRQAGVQDSYRKLTRYSQEKNILRSMPVFPFINLSIVAVKQLVIRSCRRSRSKWTASVVKVLCSLDRAVLDMSLVDFAFYSAYALMGSWSSRCLFDLLSRLLAFAVMHQTMMRILELLSIAICGANQSSKAMARSIEDLDKRFFVEGSLKESCRTKKHPRLLEPFFYLRLYLFQVITIGTYHMAGMSIGGVLSVQTVFFSHFWYTVSKKNPFKGYLQVFEKTVFEISISSFIISTAANLLGLRNHYLDIGIIGLVILSIFAEALTALASTVAAIKHLCKRRRQLKARPARIAQLQPVDKRDAQRMQEKPGVLNKSKKRMLSVKLAGDKGKPSGLLR